MKRRPDPTVAFTVTRKRDFFGRYLGDTERIKLKDQFAVLPAADESVEETGTLRLVEIGERAQFAVVMQLFAQELLVGVIKIACLFRLRAARSHLRAGGSLDLVESLVRESNHQMRKRFGQLFVVNKDRKAVLFDRRRRNQGHLAIADKNRGGSAAIDRRAKINLSAAQRKDRRVAREHQIGHRSEWPTEILRAFFPICRSC